MTESAGLQTPTTWDRPGLEAVGFAGFVPLSALPAAGVPTTPGIYIVLRTATTPVELLEQTTARAGTPYTLADLQQRWIEGTPVVYIGKAEAARGGLRKRLGQYARRGSSHQGGRSIWQLADHEQLLVCWAETPGESAEAVEIHYREQFAEIYQRWPFANRRR